MILRFKSFLFIFVIFFGWGGWVCGGDGDALDAFVHLNLAGVMLNVIPISTILPLTYLY